MLKKPDIIKLQIYSILKLENLNKQVNPINIINNQLIFRLKEINLNNLIKNQRKMHQFHQVPLFQEPLIKSYSWMKKVRLKIWLKSKLEIWLRAIQL